MANSGGGVIVFGVEESSKAAQRRCDVGEIGENYERALRMAAVTAISPPIFGLEIHHLGPPELRCLVIVVSASIDGPHLIYKGDFFGAPIRNDADTVWMKERQIEATYRARFDERRHATEALDNLYREAATGRDSHDRAWAVGVARPRIRGAVQGRPNRDQARWMFKQSGDTALTFAGRGGVHPLESVDRLNPRPGLRRWVAPNATVDSGRWKEAWASIHFDGSVSIASAVGAHRTREGSLHGSRVRGAAIECMVADLMAMVSVVGGSLGPTEYEVRVGIEWTGADPLVITTIDTLGFDFDGTSIPVAQFTPVTTTVRADAEHWDYLRQVRELAQDCVNQGGVSYLQSIDSPPDGA